MTPSHAARPHDPRIDDPIDHARCFAALSRRLFDAPERTPHVGRYRVLRTLGRGGVGRVYLARDDRLARDVAIKVVDDVRAATGERGQRLIREARALARLRHPHVVEVFEAGHHEGQPYVVMEYVRGVDLRRWLALRPRPRAEILAHFLAAARGLGAIHDAGLVHGDIKPDNLLLGDDGRLRVADFGLAGDLGAPTGLEATGGTPAYAAPELLRGRAASPASDQYAWSVAVYEALVGRLPSEDGGAGFDRVDLALCRGMSPDPAARFPSMAALTRALTRRRAPATRRWVTSTIVGAAAIALWRLPAPAPCARHAADARTRWADVRLDVRTQWLASGIPSAPPVFATVEARVSSYVATLADARLTACAKPVDATATCLEAREAAVVALIDALRHPDAATVEHAAAAGDALPPLAACGVVPNDTDAGPTAAEQRTLAVAAIDVGLAHFARAETELLRLAPDSPSAAARVALLRAAALRGLGRFDDARAVAEEGYVSARGHGIDALAGELAATIAFVVGVELGRPAAAEPWLRQATAIADADDDPAAHARVLSYEASVASAAGQYEEAAAKTRLVLALPVVRDDPDRRDAAWHNLGADLLALGRHGDAREAFARAWQGRVTGLGDEHPSALDSELGLAAALEGVGDFEGSLTRRLHAVMSRARTLGARHPRMADALTGLGNAYKAAGQPEPAARAYRRAASILAETRDPDHLDRAVVAHNLATVLAEELQQFDEAETWAHRAIAGFEHNFGPDHPHVAFPLTTLGEALTGLGRPDAAVDALRRALELRRSEQVTPSTRAYTQLALARARRQGGASMDDVAKLLDAAQAAWTADPAEGAALARLTAFRNAGR